MRRFKRDSTENEANALVQGFTLAVVSVYGGYFNGGLGIVLLAAFSLLGHRDINSMQGLKNLVSSVLTAIAVSVYAFGGAILWREALVMMLAAYLTEGSFWFIALGIPTLLANGLWAISKRGKAFIGGRIAAIQRG